MEKDDEVSGTGNSYTTEFRQYDPRLGRWKSLDPLMAKFPWMSPYVAFNNNPVFYIDPLGLEGGNPDDDKEILSGENNDLIINNDVPENECPLERQNPIKIPQDIDQDDDRKRTQMGMDAHATFDEFMYSWQPAYQAMGVSMRVNQPIRNNIKLRPDLILPDNNSGQAAIYELKPHTYLSKPKPLRQVTGYVRHCNIEDPSGVGNYHLGPRNNPKLMLPIPGTVPYQSSKTGQWYVLVNAGIIDPSGTTSQAPGEAGMIYWFGPYNFNPAKAPSWAPVFKPENATSIELECYLLAYKVHHALNEVPTLEGPTSVPMSIEDLPAYLGGLILSSKGNPQRMFYQVLLNVLATP